MQNTLDEMYDLAKNNNEPFYNLIELMKNQQTIMTALHNIKSNKGSKTVGIDNKTIDYYLHLPYEDLVSQVQTCIEDYNPEPVRRKYIPKENSDKLRPLGIPTMIDRIIQEITRLVIEPIAEAKFYKFSYGFRPMRSAEHAMAEILEKARKSKTYWVIEGDIKGYFDNINHNKLITMLWKIGIKDKRVLSIIKKMLKSGIVEEDGEIYPSDLGSPQGGIISPLLANIYLNFFDWMIAEEFDQHHYINNYERRDKGLRAIRRDHKPVYSIRYADDWVVLCSSKKQADTLLIKIRKYLKHQLSLELSEEKTKITNLVEEKASFLGFEFFVEPRKKGKGNKMVAKMIPDRKKSNKKVREINREIRAINKMRLKNVRNIAEHIETINAKIVGLTNYYSIANSSTFFKSWDNRISYQQYRTFKRRNGNKGRWTDLTVKAGDLNNRIARHKGRKDQLYYVEVDNVKVGITKFYFTSTKDGAIRAADSLTPYTKEGRARYEKIKQKKLPLKRQGVSEQYLEHLRSRTWYATKQAEMGNHKYNFEYIMNSEYAYLRDKGKCKCCEIFLVGAYHRHHIDPTLDLDKVNKVKNLASVCTRCHELIHSKRDPHLIFNTQKYAEKILKYRNLLIEKQGYIKNQN